MTKEEFNAIAWTRDSIIEDDYGHRGHIISVNFEFGVIHYNDDVKQCSFGRGYTELRYCGEEQSEKG